MNTLFSPQSNLYSAGPYFSGWASRRNKRTQTQEPAGEKRILGMRPRFILKKMLIYTALMPFSLLMSVGALEMATYDKDRPVLPGFNYLPHTAPNLLPKLVQNTTAHLVCKADATYEESWQALQPTLEILKALSPEIETWVRQRHERKKLFFVPDNFVMPNMTTERDPDAPLYITRKAWRLNDGDKTAELAHEFRHTFQGGWLQKKRDLVEGIYWLLGWIDPTKAYININEEEGFDYSRQAIMAMGNYPSQEWANTHFWLYQRNRYHIRDPLGQTLVQVDQQDQTKPAKQRQSNPQPSKACESQ